MTDEEPGFYLHGSSRLEQLAQALAIQLRTLPLTPLEQHDIVVHGPSMARWLDQQITLHNGVSCQISCPLPGNWLWQLHRKLLPDLPDEDPLSRAALPWHIYPLLSQLPENNSDLQPLRQWLQGKADLERWRIAEQIADLIDRYQYYRSDWLQQWGKHGKDNKHPQLNWQAWLWQQLQAQYPQNRASLLQQLHQHLQQTGASRLPKRLDCFALPTLPEIMLQIFQALSRHIPVHFWQFQPSPDYWQDLSSSRQWIQAQLQAEPDTTLLQGHPLLMDWGRAIRTLDRQIWSMTDPLHEHLEEHLPSDSSQNMLHHLQQQIRDTIQPESPISCKIDDSIQIHRCHTPMRECETLRDHLLHLLQQNTDLQPEDILVLASDMQTYAPCIHAVFGNDSQPALPYNLSDVPPLAEQPLIQTLLDWLALPESRMSFTQLWTQLESTSVQARLDLDLHDLDQLQQQFHQAGARWGLNPQHRQALGLPDHPWFSWDMASHRLLLGQLMDEKDMLSGIAPIPMKENNQNSQAVGAIGHYLQRLDFWSRRLRESRTSRDWAALLGTMLDELTEATDEEEHSLMAIRLWLDQLASREETELFPASVIHHMARQYFSSVDSSLRQYSGGITFCGLQPLRGVPFRIICILGMDDERFPGRDRRSSFDGMRLAPRAGDPAPAQDDRSLMLETLMACREQLWISYSGRDPRSNETRPAALPVRQLLQSLQQGLACAGQNMEEMLILDHPLHPFDRRLFQREQASFSQHWYQLGKTLCQPRADVQDESSALTLPVVQDETTVLHTHPGDWIRFFNHPVRHFLQQHLKLSQPETDPLDEDEPFMPDNLQNWQLKQNLIQQHYGLQSVDVDELLARAQLPPPPMGTALLRQLQEKQGSNWPELPSGRGQWREEPFEIHLRVQVDDHELYISGLLPCTRDEQGIIQLEAGSAHLGRWASIHTAHILACASGLNSETLWLTSTTGLQRLQPLPQEQALQRLQQLAQLFLQGQFSPVLMLPRAGWVWYNESQKSDAPSWSAIETAFHGRSQSQHKVRGDKDDFWLQQILGKPPRLPESETFINTHQALVELLEVPTT